MQWLKDLARVAIWPRRTMREILTRPSQKAAMAVVLLAIAAGSLGDVDARELNRVLALHPAHTVAIVVAVVLVVFLMMVALFYLVAWMAFGIGRFLEGRGSAREVRLALAWGLAPVVWGLVYRIPAAAFFRTNVMRMKVADKGMSFDPGMLAEGCGLASLFVLLDAIFFVWWVATATLTLAEAHHYSPLRALGTLALCMIAPFVVVLAAVLAFL